jgi:hypothetical protein
MFPITVATTLLLLPGIAVAAPPCYLYMCFSCCCSLSSLQAPPESKATLPHSVPWRGVRGFSRFTANESLRRTGLHLYLSANPVFTSLYLRSPVHIVPSLVLFSDISAAASCCCFLIFLRMLPVLMFHRCNN